MQHSDARKGMPVYFIPQHAKGDVRHIDVELGVISSVSFYYIYVKFGALRFSQGIEAQYLMPVNEIENSV